MFPFIKKTLPVLGIDISTTSVKLVELNAHNRFALERYIIEPLPENSVSEKVVNDVEAVGAAIARAFKKSRSKVNNVAIAVSGSSVITKTITMPAGLPDHEMEVQVRLEADQYIPFSIEEVAMDFEVLGEVEDNPDQVEVLLAVSRLENVENRIAAVSIAGLVVKVVDIEAFVLENAITAMVTGQEGGDLAQVIAVADIGSTITEFSVIENFKTIFSREQSFGSAKLAGDIQRRYGLSYEEAIIARESGGLPSNYESEVLAPFRESVIEQIDYAQQFSFSSGSVNKIDRLILAGGCASMSGIAELAEEKIGIPTVVANPFANMSISSKTSPDMLTKDAPSMLIAYGLALRGFDKCHI